MIAKYSLKVELTMQMCYKTLSAKDRRLYATAEALKFEYGGISYISRVLNCDRNTIYRGIRELEHPEEIPQYRIRVKGGGRKQSINSITDIDKRFFEVLMNYTAGDPMDEKI